MSTGERASNGNYDVVAFRTAWIERTAADTDLACGAGALIGTEDGELDVGALDAVVASVAASAIGEREPTDSEMAEGARAALVAGRTFRARDVDLVGLQRLFGHLDDEMEEWLLRRSADADGCLCRKRAASIARRVREAMAPPLAEATRGWFDEAGRKLRHDVKTPLQATSLNLELLTLESAERGLDTAALDTIQGSLDQVVEMLLRAEPANG